MVACRDPSLPAWPSKPHLQHSSTGLVASYSPPVPSIHMRFALTTIGAACNQFDAWGGAMGSCGLTKKRGRTSILGWAAWGDGPRRITLLSQRCNRLESLRGHFR